MNIHEPLCASFVLALGALASGQTAAPAKTSPTPPMQAHLVAPTAKVVGLELRRAAPADEQKKDLGEIGDLLIDPHSGEVRYAVLEVGGFLGIGEDKRVVPWSYIQIERDKNDGDKLQARTSLTEAQIESAPKSKMHQVFDAELDRRIEATFGKDEAWAYAGTDAPSFLWLSQMSDARVDGAGSKEVGKVQEIALAPQNGCVAYVVVDTNEEAGDKDIALPFSRLSFTQDKDKKVSAKTSVENARLQSAPEFDEKEAKRMASTAWITELSTYYACDPFWKSTRFASARKLPSPKK